MFTNQKACTVYEKTVRERAPAYIRHEFSPIYWENVSGQRKSGSNRNPADGMLCIIPGKAVNVYVPQPDDRIVCGICMDDSPPETALTVMEVKDFRYGSKSVRHLEVSAV